MPHVQGCLFCLLEKLTVIFGFAAIGLVCIFGMLVDAVHFRFLMAAKDLIGYFIAIVGISVVPKMIDRFHGLLDQWGL